MARSLDFSQFFSDLSFHYTQILILHFSNQDTIWSYIYIYLLFWVCFRSGLFWNRAVDRNYITPSPLCDQSAIQSSLRNGPDPDSHKTIATTHIYARTLPLHDCPMSIVVMKARNASGVYTCFTPSKSRASLGMINATTVALALYLSAACFFVANSPMSAMHRHFQSTPTPDYVLQWSQVRCT